MLPRLEHESVECMMDLVSNFFETGDLVLNTSAGTRLTAKAYLPLPGPYRFVG